MRRINLAFNEPFETANAALEKGDVFDYYVISQRVFDGFYAGNIGEIPKPSCPHNIYRDLRTLNVLVQKVPEPEMSETRTTFDQNEFRVPPGGTPSN